MIHHVFSIYDQKAAAFLPPFILPRKEMAIRTFTDCVQSDDHQFGSHPEDYTLMSLGTFNDENGRYDDLLPEVVVTGLECRITHVPENSGNGAASISGNPESEHSAE